MKQTTKDVASVVFISSFVFTVTYKGVGQKLEEEE